MALLSSFGEMVSVIVVDQEAGLSFRLVRVLWREVKVGLV